MSEKGTPTEGSFDHRRRTVLKAVGAGSALSAFAGVGAASGRGSTNGNGETDEGCWCEPCIDRLAGYTALADSDEDEWPARPDHAVDMYIEPRHVLFQETSTEETDVEPGPGVDSGEPEAEQFPDFFFDPVGLRIEAGDVVEFHNESTFHTITAFHPRFDEPPYYEFPQRVPDGVAPFSSPPVMNEEHWLYRFDEPGVYDLFCLPHYDLGMVMRLVAVDGDDAEFEEPGPNEDLPTAVRTVFDAPEMSVENILEEGSVAWDDLTIEEKLDIETLFGEG